VYPSEGAFLYPPHTIAAVASVLRGADWRAEVVDAVVDGPGPDAVASQAARARCPIIGVAVSYATMEIDSATLRRLRQACPDAQILAFGPVFRFMGQDGWGQGEATAVLRGEPELLFLAACERVAEGGALPPLVSPQDLGAEGYDDDGWLLDLDSLPCPAWDLLPWERYPFLSVMSSRGCDDECAYCPYVAAQGHRYRPRSAASVVAELAWLAERFGPRRVVLRDPVFARDRQRVLDICAEIVAHPELGAGQRFTWECESRPEHFDADLLRWMKKAGCGWIKIGLETTDGQVLRNLKRLRPGETRDDYVARAADVVRACREVGIRCRVFTMVGLPGQTGASVAETTACLRQMKPTAVGVKALEHYPGARWDAGVSRIDDVAREQAEPLLRLKDELDRTAAAQRRGWRSSVRARLRKLRK
jgi:anaerobic magnesium-protoporphyrin IX monomethyl ester cyclase